MVNNIVLSTQTGEHQTTSFKATFGTLESVKLEPQSATVGADTTLKMSLKTKNAIPRNGNLVIKISEFWNEGSISDFVGYFSTLTCDNLVIKGESGDTEIDHALYDCRYFQNPPKVTVQGAF